MRERRELDVNSGKCHPSTTVVDGTERDMWEEGRRRLFDITVQLYN
jgi:hypothetical protein